MLFVVFTVVSLSFVVVFSPSLLGDGGKGRGEVSSVTSVTLIIDIVESSANDGRELSRDWLCTGCCL